MQKTLLKSRPQTIGVMVVALIAVIAGIGLTHFDRPGLQVAYLYPASGAVHNIWLADPRHPDQAEQVTFSKSGIYDFAVRPDGQAIAFAELDDSTSTTEIKLLDLQTGSIQSLTHCIAEGVDCKTAAWRPDGRVLAYERYTLEPVVTGAGIPPVRIGLLDMGTDPITAVPLYDDPIQLGYRPQWSGDGQRIALVDPDGDALLVYDFEDGTTDSIPSRYGAVGTLSPDGERLIFPEMTLKGQQMFTHLKIADLQARQFSELTSPDDPIDDKMPTWNPDGERVAFARQYVDDRWTPGHQVFLLRPDDGTLTPLVVDEGYHSSYFQWDTNGDHLVLQRLPEQINGGEIQTASTPEVWVYTLATGDLVQVAVDAFHPRWVQ